MYVEPSEGIVAVTEEYDDLPLDVRDATALYRVGKYIKAPHCEQAHEIEVMPTLSFSPCFRWILWLFWGRNR